MGRRARARAEIPTTFPGYAAVEEIATGTFATVYRATELGTGRRVALKVLRVGRTSKVTAEIFDKELGALSLLSNHPNITTLYSSFFTPEGRPVLALELCRGSLAQRARQLGPLEPAEVVRTGVKIAGALETAHRAGLLHRDMKPQNILVSEFDEPVLADFGVAVLQSAAQSTEGIFGFTTLHAPPEALEGHPLSPSADIYGLASSMYQLLLGHGPFAAYEGEGPASVILRILRDPAPRPPVAGLPIALADLLQDALDKDPARRPQTAGAFAEALREVEAEAGWPVTSYVVWGNGVPTTSPSGAEAGSPPSAPAPGTPGGRPAATPSPAGGLPFVGVVAGATSGLGQTMPVRPPLPTSVASEPSFERWPSRDPGQNQPGHAPSEPPIPGSFPVLGALPVSTTSASGTLAPTTGTRTVVSPLANQAPTRAGPSGVAAPGQGQDGGSGAAWVALAQPGQPNPGQPPPAQDRPGPPSGPVIPGHSPAASRGPGGLAPVPTEPGGPVWGYRSNEPASAPVARSGTGPLLAPGGGPRGSTGSGPQRSRDRVGAKSKLAAKPQAGPTDKSPRAGQFAGLGTARLLGLCAVGFLAGAGGSLAVALLAHLI